MVGTARGTIGAALSAEWAFVLGHPMVCSPSDMPAGEGGGHGARTAPTDAPGSRGASQHPAYINGVPLQDVLGQLRAGSRDALEALYVVMHEPLWRLAMILVRSRETAEEIVQTVFLMVWVRREHFRPDTDLYAYLRTAVRNEARQLGRHARVVHGAENAVQSEVLDAPALGQAPPAPDHVLEVKEFWDAYQRALAALTDRERVALQLRLEEELSFEEIGHMLGVSNVGARKIVLRAEEQARRLLLGHKT